MTYIYTVLKALDYEPADVIGSFSSLEEAELAIREYFPKADLRWVDIFFIVKNSVGSISDSEKFEMSIKDGVLQDLERCGG